MSDLILYFENSRGIRIEIGRPSSMDEASQIISDFLKRHNYKSYYTRMWTSDNDEVYYDVGSHSEFFVLVDEIRDLISRQAAINTIINMRNRCDDINDFYDLLIESFKVLPYVEPKTMEVQE